MTGTLSAETLDIDLGNSAMKYRFDGRVGRIVHQPNGEVDVDGLRRELRCSVASAVTRIRVCSVLNSERTRRFEAQMLKNWGVALEFARSLPVVGFVKNGYREPSSLGVDRWMVVLAAYHRCSGTALVIDLGTAITLDYIRSDGQHLGGYIVPGTHLSQRALLTDTASIDASANAYINAFAGATELLLQPGSSTQEAVSRGALLMVRNLIEFEVERLRALYRQSPTVFLCGGGAPEISSHLQCSHEMLPNLVLDGLDLALP